jgi:hypothetical protein
MYHPALPTPCRLEPLESGKRLVVFVDDINLPAKEQFGSQASIFRGWRSACACVSDALALLCLLTGRELLNSSGHYCPAHLSTHALP